MNHVPYYMPKVELEHDLAIASSGPIPVPPLLKSPTTDEKENPNLDEKENPNLEIKSKAPLNP